MHPKSTLVITSDAVGGWINTNVSNLADKLSLSRSAHAMQPNIECFPVSSCKLQYEQPESGALFVLCRKVVKYLWPQMVWVKFPYLRLSHAIISGINFHVLFPLLLCESCTSHWHIICLRSSSASLLFILLGLIIFSSDIYLIFLWGYQPEGWQPRTKMCGIQPRIAESFTAWFVLSLPGVQALNELQAPRQARYIGGTSGLHL